MADDIRLVIGVDNKGVLSAIKSTETLESKVKKLSATYERGGIGYTRYRKGLEDLSKAYKRGEKELRDYANATRAAERANKAAKAAAKAEAQAVRDYARARREATEANRRYDAEAKKAARAAEEVAREEEKLKNKYVQGYTAMNIYTKELNDLAVARKKDIITADQQKDMVAQLNAQMKAGTGVFANAASGMQVVGRRASRTGVLAQQAGYQFGDFAVQVQSGTNPMIAFGQQATQLIGTFSMLAKSTRAIMAFSALGVIVPVITAVAGALMRVREETDEASKSLEDYRKKVENLRRGITQKEREYLDVIAAEKLSLKEANKQLEARTESIKKQNESVEFYTEKEKENVNLAKEAVALARARYQEFIALREEEERLRQTTGGTNELLEKGRKAQLERNRVGRQAVIDMKAQLKMSKTINEYGKDSVEVATLRAQQEAISKNLTTEHQKEYVRLALEIREAQKATEDTADAAAGIAPALQSAVNQANAFASAMGRARDASAGIGISTAGINAQIDALKSGSSEVVAKAKGAAATLRKQLTSSLPSYEAGGAASAAIERQVQERYQKELLRGQALEQLSGLTRSTSGGGGGGSSSAQTENALEKLRERLQLEEALLGKTEAQREVIQALGVDYEKIYGAEATEKVIARIEKMKELAEEEARIQSIADTIQSSMSDAFMSMIDGTKSAKDAFKDMARAIIKQLYDILVVQQLVGSFDAKSGEGSGLVGTIMKGISGALQSADGNVFSGGSHVKAYAKGGVVNGPTFFPMTGGKTGLMGEAGPEAIMPLKRGADGKLGVQAEGGGGNKVTVVQNFSFQASGDESVKKLIAQAAPQIADMTKRSIVDDRRRGGQMKTAFG